MRLLLVSVLAFTWSGFWFTPDQQGQRLFRKGEYAAAAEAFHDPMWQGTAWFRAGDFKKAATAFSRRETPEAFYNKANALVMLGQYEVALNAYDAALKKRPDWKDARENREIARLRAERTKTEGGDFGDQRIGADKIVFDRKKDSKGGQDTEVTAAQQMSAENMQALWLRKVTTKPADFLKAKFEYQYQVGKEEGGLE